MATRDGYLPSTSRLKEYERMKGPDGASRDMRNLDYWSGRASANSQLGTRGSDGPMKLHSTGKQMESRSTASAPRKSRTVDRNMNGDGDQRSTPDALRAAAKSNVNDVGSSYMPNVRRKS
jgi:hypothetical protein